LQNKIRKQDHGLVQIRLDYVYAPNTTENQIQKVQ